MIEIWKDVKGYEGKYQVSNIGRVKSLERIVNRKNGTHQIVKEKILQPINHEGYKRLMHIGRVHRLVAEAFIPNPENKPEINHINGIKDDNRVENLEWTTRQENMKHMWETGLKSHISSFESKLKASIAQSGLSIQDILDIDEMLNNKVTSKEIEKIYKVGWRVVRNIKHRRSFYKEFFEIYK